MVGGGGCLSSQMSPLGHQRHFGRASVTSGLAPQADILLRHNICRGGPKRTFPPLCTRRSAVADWTHTSGSSPSLGVSWQQLGHASPPRATSMRRDDLDSLSRKAARIPMEPRCSAPRRSNSRAEKLHAKLSCRRGMAEPASGARWVPSGSERIARDASTVSSRTASDRRNH